MSGGDGAIAHLRRVAAECRADAADLAAVQERLEALRNRLRLEPDDSALPSAVALWIDHYYTASEACIGRVVVALDGALPSGDEWHARLLRVAALAMPTLRPAIIGSETRGLLDELRGFRHKLRHTYLIDLEPNRVGALAMTAAAAHTRLVSDLMDFVAWLESLAAGSAHS